LAYKLRPKFFYNKKQKNIKMKAKQIFLLATVMFITIHCLAQSRRVNKCGVPMPENPTFFSIALWQNGLHPFRGNCDDTDAYYNAAEFGNNLATSAKTKKAIFTWAWMMTITLGGITGDSESYSSSAPGVSIGGKVPVAILPNQAAIIAGIKYSQEGSQYTSSQYIPGGQEQKVENKVRLNYLRLPIMVRKYTKSGFYGEAGLQPGLLLSAKDKHDGQTDNLKGDYKTVDMGLGFGIGYEFKKFAGIHLSFNPGITNINKKGGPNDGKKDRNQSFALGVDWWF
jgi:hypothetical protein